MNAPAHRRFGVAVVLAAIAMVAAYLRLSRLGSTSLWLDEILNIEILRQGHRPWYAWILGFERENGPLYYAIHGLSLRLMHHPELAFRLPAALVGLASVVFVFFVARKTTGRSIDGLVACALLAVSPLHVYYSREGRPYALVTLAVLATVLFVLGREGRPRPAALGATLLLAAETMAISLPIIASAAIVTTVDALLGRRSPGKAHSHGDPRVFVPAAVTTGVLAWCVVLYARFPQNLNPTGFHESFTRLGAAILNSWIVTSESAAILHPITLVAALLAIVGYARIEDRRAANVVLALALLPVVGTIALLIVSDHWFSIRYAIAGLTPFLILVAAGIVELARAITGLVVSAFEADTYRASRIACCSLTVALTAPFAFFAWAPARTEPFQRADWARLARILAEHAHPKDLVLASTDWSAVSLGFYLHELHSPIVVLPVNGVPEPVRSAMSSGRPSWIVMGGYGNDALIQRLTCRMYCIAREPIEQGRIFFSPGLASFLEERATPAERGRFVDAFSRTHHGRLDLGPGDAPLLGSGWYPTHVVRGRTFRWVGRDAACGLPVAAGHFVARFRAAPYTRPDMPQNVTVKLRGRVLGRFELTRPFHDYEVDLGTRDAPAVLPLTFDFDWAIAPASITDSRDHRPLAAMFDWIEVARAGAPATSDTHGAHPAEMPVLFRVDDSPGAPASPPVADCGKRIGWPVDRVEFMRLRLGIAGLENIPLRTRFDVVRALLGVLPPRECLSSAEFLDDVYPILFDREPDRVGRTYYMADMASGSTRELVLCKMLRDESKTKSSAER